MFLCNAIVVVAYTQEGCYTCDQDSVKAALPKAKTAADKIKLLTYIIDFSPAADSANYYIDQLLELNAKEKILKDEPYKIIRVTNEHYKQKDYKNALASFQKATYLFDQQKKKIPALLLAFRNLFNLTNLQEDRYQFYKRQLDQYLVNGPIENTSSAYYGIAGYYTYKADYNQAINYYLKAADVFKTFYPYWYYNTMGVIGVQYADWGNYNKALEYINYSLEHLEASYPQNSIAFSKSAVNAYYELALSEIKIYSNDFSGAITHAEKIINGYKEDSTGRMFAKGLLLKGWALTELNQTQQALKFLMQAQYIINTYHKGRMTTTNSTIENNYVLYLYYNKINKQNVAEKHLIEAYKKAKEETNNRYVIRYLKEILSYYVQQNNMDAARPYTKEYLSLNKKMEQEQSLFKVAQYESERKQQEQLSNINALKQERALQQAAITKRNTILIISFIALVLIVFSMIALYRQLRINKKNLHTLKTTQQQLIQSEKMASLGELTSGIAHEIQNPLNFVNNFSEVSTELIEEMVQELKNGNNLEALELAEDVKNNLEKVVYHGSRADTIVKGMLQHSRAGTGKKELTNVNQLVDEYIKLTYYGIRAKEPSFNAVIETYFDPAVGEMKLIPQDLGRVLLNLLSNAFYAVSKKKQENYQPTVIVRTELKSGLVQIAVRDNGTGIPQNALNKIYQPFYTTKPTGEGTGLGLSLSYDIITKGHGGDIKVFTKEGEFTEFVITLSKKEKQNTYK